MWKLFVAPNTWARVSTIAFEEAGVAFDTELMRLKLGQQNTPDFLKVSPEGKVPTLIVDAKV